MSITFNVTPDALDSLVEFDCAFRVASDGSVSDRVDNYAPSVYDGEIESSDWEFFSAGYTGQYGYNGPTMHPSEQLSGSLARDILDTPGVYVIVADEVLCDDECGGVDDCADFGDHFPAGWCVLRLKG